MRRIALYPNVDFDQSLLSEIKVVECISVAKELEDLEHVFEPDGLRQIMFPRVFLATWPELYHLKLEIDIDYGVFTGFCQRHGDSLLSLHLENVHLFGGTWGMLLQVMKKKTGNSSQKLKSISFAAAKILSEITRLN